MELDDLHFVRPIEHLVGEHSLCQDANTAEENSEDDGNQQNNSDEREDCENQIADVVALADARRFIPRDLCFVVHGVEKSLRLATADGSGDYVEDGSGASREKSTGCLLRTLQCAQPLARDLRRGIGEQGQRQIGRASCRERVCLLV